MAFPDLTRLSSLPFQLEEVIIHPNYQKTLVSALNGFKLTLDKLCRFIRVPSCRACPDCFASQDSQELQDFLALLKDNMSYFNDWHPFVPTSVTTPGLFILLAAASFWGPAAHKTVCQEVLRRLVEESSDEVIPNEDGYLRLFFENVSIFELNDAELNHLLDRISPDKQLEMVARGSDIYPRTIINLIQARWNVAAQ